MAMTVDESGKTVKTEIQAPSTPPEPWIEAPKPGAQTIGFHGFSDDAASQLLQNITERQEQTVLDGVEDQFPDTSDAQFDEAIGIPQPGSGEQWLMEPQTRHKEESTIGMPEERHKGWMNTGIGTAFRTAWWNSISGMATRKKAPVQWEPETTAQRLVSGAVGLVGDAPGIVLGTLAGTGGGPGGMIAGGMAGAAGLRALYINRLTKGTIETPQQFFDAVKSVVPETLKGYVEGRFIEAFPAIFGKASKTLSGELGEKTFEGAAKAIKHEAGAKIAGEVAGFATVPALKEGRLPTKEDFLDAAVLIGAARGISSGVQSTLPVLFDEYVKNGKHPSNIVKEATVRETLVKALREGKTSVGVSRLAEHLVSIDPGFEATDALEISSRVRIATPEMMAAENMPTTQPGFVTGQTVTALEDGAARTTISLYRGHDADTVAEEWYHRYYDRMSPEDRAAYNKYHAESGDKRQENEHFGQEGRDFFFSEKLHEKAGGIRRLFQGAKDSLLALIGRVRDLRGIQIPQEIQEIYKKAGSGAAGTVGSGESFQTREAPIWYSKLEQVATQKLPGHADAKSMADTLKNTAITEGMPSFQIRKLDSEYGARVLEKPLFEVTKHPEDLVDMLVDGDLTAHDPAEKYSIRPNHDRISGNQDIHALISGVAKVLEPEIDDARGGVVSFDQTKALARETGMTVESLLRSWEKGKAYNHAEITAARCIMISEGESLLALKDKVLKGDASQNDKLLLLQTMNTYASLQAVVTGMGAEAGRALSAHRIMASSDLLRGIEIREIIDRNGGEDGIQKIAETIDDIMKDDEVATGESGVEGQAKKRKRINHKKLGKAVRDLTQPGWWDIIQEIRINGLLSGPLTHVANITSNFATMVQMYPELKIAEKVGAARRKVGIGSIDRVQPGEPESFLFGTWMGRKEALVLAGRAMLFGDSSDNAGKADQPYQPALTGENIKRLIYGEKSKQRMPIYDDIVSRGFDLLGTAIRLPGRALQSADEFFKTLNFRGSLWQQAYHSAALEGWERGSKRFGERVAELVEHPTDGMVLIARDASREATYTTELEGTMKKFAAVARTPIGRVVIPFVRTPWNILRFTNARTPMGIIDPKVREDLLSGGSKRDLALARISLGSTLMAYSAGMAAAGYVTGGGPKNKGERNVWLQENQPYSFKVPGMDSWVSYNRVEPLGMLLGLGADCYEIMAQWTGDDLEMDEMAMAIVGAYSKNLLSKTWLKGVSQAIDALDDPTRKMMRYARDTAVSFTPASSLLRTVEKTIHPELSETDGILDSFRAMVPGLSDELPPRRDLFGEPIKVEGGWPHIWVLPFSKKTIKNDPVAKEMIRLGVGIGNPSRTINLPMGLEIELQPDEYDRLCELAGKEITLPQYGNKNLHDALEDVMSSPAYEVAMDGEDYGKGSTIHNIVNAYRNAARDALSIEFDRIDDLKREAENAKRYGGY